jgi:protein transport protein SEC31
MDLVLSNLCVIVFLIRVWTRRRCELRDPTGCSISDIAWNPDQGLHLVTAGGDDKNPVIKLWDLRSSTSVPLATLQGHTQGVMSVSWCPSDPSLLLSCGKDNKTLLWDLFHLQPVYELPVVSTHKAGDSVIGGGAGFGGPAPSSAAGGSAGAFDGFFGGTQAQASIGQSMFGNLAASAGSRRYHVAWSPCIPAVISTCSFDRLVFRVDLF